MSGKNYDVLIVGGGIAGISCGLTLSSTENKFDWAKERKYLIIDEGKSDLLYARLLMYPVSGRGRMEKKFCHI